MPFSLLVPPTYTIGQAALGGIIFYILQPSDPGYDFYKQHGLIAATSDQSSGIGWGCNGTTISGADGTALGTGAQNTTDILASCAARPIAASVAAAHNGGGYTDWYLPSQNELNILYINKPAVGGFSNNSYWSSSERDGSRAYLQTLDSGFQYFTGKINTYLVRAIRSF